MQPTGFEIENLSATEQDALSLTEAALHLEQVKAGANASQRDGIKLVEALNHNLEIWVAIRALAQSQGSQLPAGLRGNLIQLSDFVAQATFSQGIAITDSTIDALININLQLSEGLLEGRKKAMVAN